MLVVRIITLSARLSFHPYFTTEKEKDRRTPVILTCITSVALLPGKDVDAFIVCHGLEVPSGIVEKKKKKSPTNR